MQGPRQARQRRCADLWYSDRHGIISKIITPVKGEIAVHLADAALVLVQRSDGVGPVPAIHDEKKIDEKSVQTPPSLESTPMERDPFYARMLPTLGGAGPCS